MTPDSALNPWRLLLCLSLLFLVDQCSSSRAASGLPFEKPRHDQVAKARAEESFIQARDLERRQLYEEAEEEYRDACKFDTSSKELRNALVARLLGDGKFTQALAVIKGRKKNREIGSDDKRLVAEIYLRIRDFQKAIETLESIADKNGADYYALAIIYEATGDTAKALARYTGFSERSDVSPEMGLKIARMQLSQNQYKAADSLSSKLQRRFGDNAPVLNLRGVVSLTRGDTAAALEFFNKAVASDSSFDEGLRNIAILYLQKNDYKNAISCYETLLRHSPMLAEDVYGRTLAILYYYHKEYQKAEVLLGKLCEKLVNDDEVHFYLGLVYEAQRKNDLAQIEFEKTIALRNDFFDAWRGLISISIREENSAQALAIAERCTKRFPQIPASWRLQAWVFNVEKDYSKAIPALLKASAIDSLDASVWFDLGCAYERNKDIKNAATIFKKVLKLKPGDIATLNYLGYMWADRGIKLDSAKALIGAALLTEPDNGAFLDSYAWAFYKMGNIDSAYCYMEKAIVRINDDPVVFEHLGDILYELNRIPAAVDAYRKSIELKHETPDLIRTKLITLEPLLHHGK